MFCGNCGKENMKGAKYCSSCGTIIENGIIENKVDNKKQIQTVLNDIEMAKRYVNNAESYFYENNEIYKDKNVLDRYASLISVNGTFRQKYKAEPTEEVKQVLKKYNFNYTVKRITYLLILLAIYFAVVIISLICTKYINNISSLFTLYIIDGIIQIVLIVLAFKSKKIVDKKVLEICSNINKQYNDAYSKAYKKYLSVIEEYNNQYGNIPPKYLSLYALNYIDEMLKNKRADSLKEALNLFEEYDFKHKMIRENNKRFAQLQNQIHFQSQMILNNQRDEMVSSGITNALLFVDLISRI